MLPSITMKVSLVQTGTMRFEGTTDDGAKTLFHIPPKGEAKEAPSPFQHLALSLAACTAADVASQLEKMRQRYSRFEIELEYERAKEHPKVMTRAHLTYVFRGPAIDEEKVTRAIRLSQERYCSISAMVRRAGVELSVAHRIEGEGS